MKQHGNIDPLAAAIGSILGISQQQRAEPALEWRDMSPELLAFLRDHYGREQGYHERISALKLELVEELLRDNAELFKRFNERAHAIAVESYREGGRFEVAMAERFPELVPLTSFRFDLDDGRYARAKPANSLAPEAVGKACLRAEKEAQASMGHPADVARGAPN